MKKGVISFLRQQGLLPSAGSTALAAVSGGADSMCLLDVLHEIALECGWTICAAHFNHGLRGEEADRDEAFVRSFCLTSGIPFYSDRGDVSRWAFDHHMGVEAAARELRYRFLETVRAQTGAVFIATAHNADDNAETILMHLVRGAGTAGLCGIQPRLGHVIRPLLFASRSEIEEHNVARGIAWVEDSSNGDDALTRNRLRHQVLPILREINPEFSEACRRLARLASRDEQALSSLAERAVAPHADAERIPLAEVLSLPEAVALRVIRKMYGQPLSCEHAESVLRLCRSGSGKLSLPGGQVHIECSDLVFREAQSPVLSEKELLPGQTISLPEAGLQILLTSGVWDGSVNKSFTEYLFKTDAVCGRITVGSRRPGDRYTLRTRRCTKSLKKLLNEAAVPPWRRDAVPVFSDEAGILAVYPFGPCLRGQPTPGDTVFRILIRELEQ
ncbi:MAG: tRNA lysidine(34) synthetase TilS [Oscillospiraceae bacterium]|nr:tRNA lysidine(34) synthetase TilS [Oscillospiraceae bacterium]